MKSVSLKNYGEKLETERLNTPLSLEACYREGIDPEDLVFYPFEDFARPNTQKTIQKMNFDFYETQRQKLLKIVKKQYQSLLKTHKRTRSHKSVLLGELVSEEIERLKQKKMKYISKLVNFKLGNIKNTVEGSKTEENFKMSSTVSSRFNLASTSREFSKNNEEVQTVFKKNLEKDAALIREERIKQQKMMENEKARIIDAEKRRKEAELKLAEHLRRVRIMRERENQEKQEKIQKKMKQSEKKLQSLELKRTEDKQDKILKGKERISRVISLKNVYEETIKEIRDQIMKKENEKIEHHVGKKNKNREEFLIRIKEKNKQHDIKSKISREKIEENIEERKRMTLENFKSMSQKLDNLKTERKEHQDMMKQKNKLREVERNWNFERAQKKEEFYRKEVMDGIKSSLVRVQNIESARDFMRRFRYDLNVKTQASRAKIDQEIYLMEVKKKYDIDKINQILNEAPTETEKEFYSTR
jgi:hypothetical protein